MDALLPSLSNAGLPQPAPAGMVGLAILLAELTQALAKLPAGTQIPALVTQILPQLPQQQQPPPPPGLSASPSSAPSAAAPSVLLQLSTPAGSAQVRIPASVQIPPGAKLDITVAAAGPQPQWRLIAIDGKPVSSAPAAFSTQSLAPAASSAAAPAAAPPPPPATGIPATLVKSADPALPTGTSLVVRIVTLVAPPPPQPETQTPPESQPKTQTSLPGAPTAAAQTEAEAPAAAPVTAAAVRLASPVAAPPAPSASLADPELPPAPSAVSPAAAPVTAPAPTAAPSPAAAPLPTATSLPASAAPPSPAQPPNSPPTPAQASAVNSAPSGPPAPTAPSAPAPAAAPAPVPLPTDAPGPAPTEMSGEVLPNSDAGRPLVKTPAGLLALAVEPQSAPPAGAHVTLEVIGKPVLPAASLLPLREDEPPDKALPRRLTQLVEQLQTSGEDKQAEAVRQAIPAPGPKLAAQLLSVIASAEPAQGLPRWLSEGLATALAHGAPEAMAALGRQWDSASQPAQGPDNGDWRTLLVPMMMGGQISLIRLTTRQSRRGVPAAEREKGTRFLLDLDLSRLGPMQFDGLVKRQHKHFDLIIRTRDPLPGVMRRDIDGLFLNGLMSFGLQGSVSFRPDGRFVAVTPLTGDGNGIIFA